jgi:calcium-dependent protein kinase
VKDPTSKQSNLSVKIIDFGTAKIFDKNKKENKVIGSSYYIAPEVLTKKYDEKCDLWSCGVIMHILLTSQPPFNGANDMEILNKISLGVRNNDIKEWKALTQEAKDLINKLLERNPMRRISADDALNHQWFLQNKTKENYNYIKPEKIRKIIDNLKQFDTHVLGHAALGFLIHNNTHMQLVSDCKKFFTVIDHDNDGKISREELLKSLSEYLKQDDGTVDEDTLNRDINKIFKAMDANSNGFIEYEEFLRGAVDRSEILQNDNALNMAFRYFDKDNSGEIDIEEIYTVFGKDNVTIKESLDKILAEVDTNNDRKISFAEFSTMMRNIMK